MNARIAAVALFCLGLFCLAQQPIAQERRPALGPGSIGSTGPSGGGGGGAGGGGGSPTTTWNPSDKNANLTLSNGNLTATATAGGFTSLRAIASDSSGKRYYEAQLTGSINANNTTIGAGNSSATLASFVGNDANAVGFAGSGTAFINSAGTGGLQTFTYGDTVCVAFDIGAQKIWFRTNGGNWNNDVIANQNPATGAGGLSTATMAAGPYFPMAGTDSAGDAWTANFGGSAYAQAVPSGFVNW